MIREQWAPGDRAYFEYHCTESDDSADAHLWHHSHQQVTVLGEADSDALLDSTFTERGEAGQPKVYRVKFADGLIGEVFEDELTTTDADYYRPDPPPLPS